MKSTSRFLLISVLLVSFTISAMAQQPNKHQERRQKYMSMKVAYFTENLDLTPQEAEKFWPLYNKFEKDKGNLMDHRKMRSREFAKNADNVSEEEAKEIIDNHIEARQKETALDVKFHQDLEKILSAKKIMKLYITEVQFREYMLKQFREEHRQNSGKKTRKDP